MSCRIQVETVEVMVYPLPLADLHASEHHSFESCAYLKVANVISIARARLMKSCRGAMLLLSSDDSDCHL